MSEPLYKIRNWAEVFEVAQTRKQPREMSWVPMPTRMDGKRYRRIAAHEHGDRILGCWLVMVEVAAKRPVDRRGYLEDSDGPMGPEDLAAASGLRAESFDLAIQVLSSKGIAWLVRENVGIAIPEQPAALETFGLQDKTIQDRTEQDRTAVVKHRATAFTVDCERFASEYPRQVSDWEMQILLSEIRAQADQDKLFHNLGLYRTTEQWCKGMVPSAKNWLRDGMWKVAPKEPVGAVRAKSGVEDTLNWLVTREGGG